MLPGRLLALCASPATAAPPGHGLITDGPYDCHGIQTTIVHSVGNSAYIGDQHYVVESFTFTSPNGESETQSFGHKLLNDALIEDGRVVVGGDGVIGRSSGYARS